MDALVPGWWLSLVVSCEPHREAGNGVVGIDWGVETYATTCTGPMRFDAVENERFGAAEADALREEQRALSRALRGKQRGGRKGPSGCWRSGPAASPTGARIGRIR